MAHLHELPRGFGKTPPTEPRKKCILGHDCGNKDDRYNTVRCSVHSWTREHDDAWSLIRILSIVIPLIVLCVVAVGLNYEFNIAPERQILDNADCLYLTEYIADRESERTYAEHRYKWLCVEAVQHSLVD